MVVGSKKKHDDDPEFGRIIYLDEERKLRARRQSGESAPRRVGMTGVAAWSLVLTIIIVILIGRWLDQTWPSQISWAITLTLCGVALGCLAAWRWIRRVSRWR